MLRRDSPTFPSRMLCKPEAALEESYVQEMLRNMKQSQKSAGAETLHIWTNQQWTLQSNTKRSHLVLCGNSFYPEEKNRILLQLFSFVDEYTKVGVWKHVIKDTYANSLSKHLQIWESNLSDSTVFQLLNWMTWFWEVLCIHKSDINFSRIIRNWLWFHIKLAD